MPNYESLVNAKKFHLKKLIERVSFENENCPESQDSKVLVLEFNQNTLFRLQVKQKLNITPETIRNCLFFIISAPQKIQIDFKKGHCRLMFWDTIDCQTAYDMLTKHVISPPKSRCQKITKCIMNKIWGVFKTITWQ